MGEIAKALGQGTTLSFRGKDYKLSPLTYEVQALFELWLEKRAWDICVRAKKFLPADEYEKLRSQVSQDVASGAYSFGSQACLNATQSAPGQKELLYLMLKACPENAEVTRALIDEMWQHEFEEIAGKLVEAAVDPNPQAPAQPGTTEAAA